MLEIAIMCLSLNAFHEARGEPVTGIKAVTDVVLTRAVQNKTDICREVYKPYQFSWTNGKRLNTSTTKRQYNQLVSKLERKKDKTELKKLERITYKMTDVVLQLEMGKDPRKHKFTHYHAVSVNPKWNNGYQSKKIGSHLFYNLSKPKGNKS